ncbi:MAG: copper amine oxidase N-terminal domain-containing protein [Clostridiales bacterium]|jgi:hypothetical protein|nr:copper amine oxidase N-terminal domain-containing protein [Clostridiales bacterium]
MLKRIGLLVAVFLGVVLFPAHVFAGEQTDIWRAYAWRGEYAEFGICHEVFYGDSGFSIVVENSEYNDSRAYLAFDVEPHTRYRFSAMVRVENLAQNPEEPGGGAWLSFSHNTWYGSRRHRGEDWQRLTFEFNTVEEIEEVNLMLRLGGHWATVSGRAYFSDITLEKAPTEQSREWNVMTLLFRHFDSPQHPRSSSMTDADIAYLSEAIGHIRDHFPIMTDGLKTIGELSFYAVDEPIRVIGNVENGVWDGSWWTNFNYLTHIFDEYLAKGDYHAIIVVSTVYNIGRPWSGLGGMFHAGRPASYFQFMPGAHGDPSNPHHWLVGLTIHEMIHGLENFNLRFSHDLHGLHYGYRIGGGYGLEWYSIYMRNLPPVYPRGIDPRTYIITRLIGDFAPVPFDMELHMAQFSPAPDIRLRFEIDNPWHRINNDWHWSFMPPPLIDPEYGRTMLPLRTIGEALGGTVEWNRETRTAYIFHGEQTISLSIDEPLPNDMGMPLIVDGFTLVPARYVSEMLGASVFWDAARQAVYIQLTQN